MASHRSSCVHLAGGLDTGQQFRSRCPISHTLIVRLYSIFQFRKIQCHFSSVLRCYRENSEGVIQVGMDVERYQVRAGTDIGTAT